MKTDRFFQALRTAIVLFAVVGVFSCKENDPELEFTPEEKEADMISVSDALTQFTMQYDTEDSQGLDAAIEKVRKLDYVESVVKASDHVKVTYKDGLEIYYPFIVPSAFESEEENAALAFLLSRMEASQTTKASFFNSGGCEIFDFNSENPERIVQKRILKAAGHYAHNELDLADYFGNIYHGKEMVTVRNIENAISNPDNKIVVIATHGMSNGVITNDTVMYGEAYKDPVNDYCDIGEVDAKGNRVLNRIWHPTQYTGAWYSDMVYFTGCGVFTPDVCHVLENHFEHTTNTSSLVVGWDGPNYIGEACLLAMIDCFAQGMSFMEFYNQKGSHQHNGIFSTSSMVYTGSKKDFKPSSKSWEMESRSSSILQPKSFCYETILHSNQVRMALDDTWRKKGTFHLYFYDMLNDTYKKSNTFFRETVDWFSELVSSSDWSLTFWLGNPGVYRVSLYYELDKDGRQILVDQKYMIKTNGFKKNDVEEEVPNIKVATAVTKSADVVYGCQMAVCPDDLSQQGFLVWERNNPSAMQEIPGEPMEENPLVFSASLSGLTVGETYQTKAFVKYITGDVFYGDVKEFTTSSTSIVPTVPVPEAIDLGLPSGLKWASFNLGATKPEEYGDYYAWGETEPKDYYYWPSYQWCNGSMSSITKYNSESSQGIVDNKSDLSEYGYEDDVAHVKLGSMWRIPTVNEYYELMEICVWSWVSRNGVSGYEVTGMTGNRIFIPGAGYWDYSGYTLPGTGEYWASSTYAPETAFELFFNSWEYHVGQTQRCYGESIRPVYAE